MKEKLLELSSQEVLAYTEDMEAVDIAEMFEELEKPQAIKLFRLLPKNIAADVFSEISSEKQQEIIETLSDKEQASIINELFTDDAVDLLEEMPTNVVRKILKNASEETRQEINMLLKYPNDSAGSIMTTEYIRLKEQNTVGEVFDIIRKQGLHKETIYTCYVTNKDRVLIGFVSVKDLIFADSKAKISDIMREGVIHVHTTDTYDEVSAVFSKYGFVSLPVVDNEDKLVGIITVDDVLALIKQEHTDSVAKMAAVATSDTPYLKTSVFSHSRNRVVWLLFLMISAMLTGLVISGFEAELAVYPILIAFIPMLMGAGGNSGAQASTQIIRGMAIGEIGMKDTLRVLWKEIRVAVICGLILGSVNFLRIIVLDGWILSSLDSTMFRIATVVTLSLCSTIIMAKSLGCLLPALAKKLKLDPAIMAAPLIATILDTLSLLVYFGIAMMLLSF